MNNIIIKIFSVNELIKYVLDNNFFFINYIFPSEKEKMNDIHLGTNKKLDI